MPGERRWGAEQLSARLAFVCQGVVTEGRELSRGAEQSLQDGERKLLLRKIKWGILRSFSFTWLEESTSGMFPIALAKTAC